MNDHVYCNFHWLSRVAAVSLGLATTLSLRAQELLPYEATFETENGFLAGSVDGQIIDS